MTRDITPDLKAVRLFFTQPHECSYLPDKEATTAFVDPTLAIDNTLYSELTRMGFRRSGRYYYAPRCRSCRACISTRIPARRYSPNRQQRRCRRRNQDIDVTLSHTVNIAEHYDLYERYIRTRHRDGDMYPPSKTQYLDFLGQGTEHTRFVEFRHRGRLMGCSVVDMLDDGLSAIYTYFEPNEDRRSLGTFAIMTLVDVALQMERPYVYLGFWVENCAKMDYKTRFKPLQILDGTTWRELIA